MCSVRHRPVPCAPNRRARELSSGSLVGVPHQPVDGADQLVGLDVIGGQLALEVVGYRRRLHRYLAGVDLTGGAVDGDDVALDDLGASRATHPAVLGVDVERLRPAHAGLAHPARHHRGVRGLAAAAGQHAAGGDHAAEVVGVGLLAHEDDRPSLLGPLHGTCGVEHHLAGGGTG
jgi:hypothetical protein